MGSYKKKIAFIVNDTDFFLSHRMSLALRCRDNFDIIIVLPKSAKNSKVIDAGFIVQEYPLQKTGINPFNEIFTVYAIFRILRREKPDFVHSFTIKPVLYGALTARWAGVSNIVVTITGLGYIYVSSSLKSRFLKPFVSFLYRWAMQTPKVRVIFQNPDDQRLFLENRFINKSRSTIIPGSGVNKDIFFPSSDINSFPELKGKFNILLPCRMLWDKGVLHAVEAFLSMDLDDEYQLVLAGKIDVGNPASISEQQLMDWQKRGSIIWLGHVSKMNDLFNQSQIICLPSYREGLPLALLEASLCARPIITTNTPGCNFLIQDYVNGLLVEPRSTKSLKLGLQNLINDHSLREKLSQNARKIALKNYTQDLINQKIVDFYNMN